MSGLLFTPGPLTTSRTVKEAMLRDWGSRNWDFIEMVDDIRRQLLQLADVKDDTYTSIIMQGSGTFGIESVISSVIPRKGRLLNIVNGAYGRRIAAIADIHGIAHIDAIFPEETIPSLTETERILGENPDITHISLVHCETTTGILNPAEEFAALSKKMDKIFILDAMSSFGGIPIDLVNIDFLISSSNKCIEGVPGFSFVIAKRQSLEKARGNARTLSLDLTAQYDGLEDKGQFRFTPPTHAIAAFSQAIKELWDEGGIEGRHGRYKENQSLLVEGMERLGFKSYIESHAPIITSFLYPTPDFDFDSFYSGLSKRGFVIYPGKLSQANTFRIGNIGRISKDDIEDLLHAIEEIRT